MSISSYTHNLITFMDYYIHIESVHQQTAEQSTHTTSSQSLMKSELHMWYYSYT